MPPDEVNDYLAMNESVNENVIISTNQIQNANYENLDKYADNLLNCESFTDDHSVICVEIIDFIITNTERDTDGRLIMPLP